jgi:hypothetical protein
MNTPIKIFDVIGLLAGFIAATVVLAAFRNTLVRFIDLVFGILIRPMSIFERNTLKAAIALSGAIADSKRGLHYSSEHNDHELSEWFLWDIIGPLVYLVAFLLLFSGDFYIFVLRFAALMHIHSSTLPIDLDLLAGVLWVVMVALWGSIVFDLSGVTPIGRPFHNFSEHSRRNLRFVGIVALLLSVVAGVLFWMWGQFEIDQQSKPLLAWVFIGLFALLLNTAIAFAGWSVFTGIASIYVLILTSVLLLCRLLQVILVVAIHIFDAVAAALIGLIDIPAKLGKIVWNWLCLFDIAWRCNMRPITFLQRRCGFSAPTQVAIVGESIYSSEESETIMNNTSYGRTTNVLGFGEFADTFVPLLRKTADYFKATHTLLTMGVLNFNRVSHSFQTRFDSAEVRDISPTPQEVEAIANRAGNFDDALRQLEHNMIDKMVEVNLAAQNLQGQCLWVQSLPMANSSVIEEAILNLKARQPDHRIIVIGRLPYSDQRSPCLRSDCELFARLRNNKIIAATILLDLSSPFAHSQGEEALELFTASAVSSLLVAHAQFQRNPTLADVVSRLGGHSSFLGMAFSSACIVNGRQSGNQHSQRTFFSKPPRDFGNVSDAINQAKAATSQTLTKSLALSIEERIDQSRPLFLVYTVPIRPVDPCWYEFTSQISSWLAGQFPTAIPVFASGNGTPNYLLYGEYFVQVSAFYPLSEVPSPLRLVPNSACISQNSQRI